MNNQEQCTLTDCHCEECSEEARAMMCEQLQNAKKELAAVEYMLRQPGYIELYEEEANKLQHIWYELRAMQDQFGGRVG